MKRYITRHGQLLGRDMIPLDKIPQYPEGETPLSPLGRKQARLLGERLKSLGFCGKIISSPYMRTLETSEIIADITGSLIIPYAPFREVFKDNDKASNYHGLTLEEIRYMYRHIDKDAFLADNWWYNKYNKALSESDEDVYARAIKGYEYIDKMYENEELLIVGHAASSGAIISYLDIEKKAYDMLHDKRQYVRTMLFNCALSIIDTKDPDFAPVYCDVSFIPYEITTANFKTRSEWDLEHFEKEYEQNIKLPDGINNIKGQKVLHIGDTLSKDFPFYRKLIELVKPDVIIHTGDMVDEVKVGRIENKEFEYRSKLKVLFSILNSTGARIIIVPGNNDKEEVIRELAPSAELYERNSKIILDGIPCRIGHEVYRMTFDCKWNMYGHGKAREEWTFDKNVPGVNLRFNVMWGAFVYSIGEGLFFRIKIPKT